MPVSVPSDRKPLSPVQAADAETRRLLIELGGEALGSGCDVLQRAVLVAPPQHSGRSAHGLQSPFESRAHKGLCHWAMCAGCGEERLGLLRRGRLIGLP